jgi:hypothetical protein
MAEGAELLIEDKIEIGSSLNQWMISMPSLQRIKRMYYRRGPSKTLHSLLPTERMIMLSLMSSFLRGKRYQPLGELTKEIKRKWDSQKGRIMSKTMSP